MKTYAERRLAPGLWPGRQRGAMMLLAALLTMLAVMPGCGGSGGVDSGGTGAVPSTLAVGPISGFGSIVVAGVHYDESAASIVDGDGLELTSAALKLGSMARIDASEVSTVGTRLEARALSIRVAEALLGPVEAVDTVAMTIRVLGQVVAVTPGTVFDETLGAGLAALASNPNPVVAVHGQVDSVTARVVATRIERRSIPSRYIVRGTASAVDLAAKRLSIGTLNVSLAELGMLPATLATGTAVRLKLRTAALAGVWTATELGLDSQALPDRDNVEIEGRVSAFTSAQRFSVDGSAVDATGATFKGGTLTLGARVEVKGRSSNGMIVARSVSVDAEEGGGSEAIELEGRITELKTTARSFVVRGVTVSYVGATFVGGTVDLLAVNREVNVKGRLAADRSQVEASSIRLEF
jgi:hypothetical protein